MIPFFFFFCSSLDFGRKVGIVFICVDLCGVRSNKLLNLGVCDLKKVEITGLDSPRKMVSYCGKALLCASCSENFCVPPGEL